jgi:hypothetical protein
MSEIIETRENIIRALGHLLSIPTEEIEKDFKKHLMAQRSLVRHEVWEKLNDTYIESRYCRLTKKSMYENPYNVPFLKKIWKQGFEHCWGEFIEYVKIDQETLRDAKEEIFNYRMRDLKTGKL